MTVDQVAHEADTSTSAPVLRLVGALPTCPQCGHGTGASHDRYGSWCRWERGAIVCKCEGKRLP
jgi:hypothetical protein